MSSGRRTTATLVGLLGLALLAPQLPSDDAAAVSPETAATRPAARSPLAPGSKPNVVVVMTDDMTATDLRWMPRTRRLIGRQGTTFTDGIAPNPLCCPARAAFVTGLESHNNGVLSNKGPRGGYQALTRGSRLQNWLRRAGYRTAFLGKHLNGYSPIRYRPESGWTVHDPLMKWIYAYRQYATWNDGDVREVRSGHVTNYLSKATGRVLRRFERRDARPFFIWVSHVAPHQARRIGCEKKCWGPPVPERRDRGDFQDVDAPSRSSAAFNVDGGEDKPFFLRDQRRKDAKHIQRVFSRRIESLQSVDRSVALTIRRLRKLGELKDTLFVFTSDNGYMLGEHRYVGKRLAYEASLRVPVVIRGPGVRRGARVAHTVTTADLTRTIVRVAGAEPPYPLDGVSLHRVLARRGAPAPRAASIVQTGGSAPEDPIWFYRGYRDRRYTYARYPDDGSGGAYEELYDRGRDASELDNLVGVAAYDEVLQQARERALALQSCAGADCHPGWDRLPAPAS